MTQATTITWSRRDWFILAFLAVLPFIAFPVAYRADTAIVAGDGIVDLPYRVLTSMRVWSGEFPFWSPEILGGADIWAYPVSGVLNPLTYLFGFAPHLLLLNLLTLFGYSLGLMGTYVFARNWGIDPTGSVVAAISYAFSGFFLSYFSVMAHGMGMAAEYLPLLMASYLFMLRKPTPKRAALAALATFGGGIFGQDQIFLYNMTQVGYLTLIGLVIAENAQRKKMLICVSVAALIGILALSVRTFPAYEMLKYSSREELVATIARTSHTAPPWKLFTTLFLPYSHEMRLQIAYFGVIPLFFFIIGIRKIVSDRHLQWALGGCVLAGINLYWPGILGSNISRIPILNWFHSPFRQMYEVFFWASLIAGAGMMEAMKEKRLSRQTLLAAAAMVLLLMTLSMHNLNLWRDPDLFVRHPISIKLVMFIAGGAVIIFLGLRRGGLKIPRYIAVITSIILIFLMSRYHFSAYMETNIKRNGTANLENIPASALFLKRLESIAPDAPLQGRAIFIGNPYNLSIDAKEGAIVPNFGMLYGIPLVQAKNELLQKRLVKFIGENARRGYSFYADILTKARTPFDLLGAKYIIATGPINDVGQPWPHLRDNLLLNIESVQMPMLRGGQTLDFTLSNKEEAELVLLCSIYYSKNQAGAPAMNIQIQKSGQVAIEKTFIAGQDIAYANSKDTNPPANTFTGNAVARGKAQFSEIRVPLSPAGTQFKCEITNILPGSTLAIAEAVLVDSEDRVTKSLHLINDYLSATLGYPQIYSDEFVSIHERKTSFPRQWLTSRIAVLKPARILKELAKASLDPDIKPGLMDISLVEDGSLAEFESRMKKSSADPGATIERTVDRPNNIAARVTSASPVFAVFSEAWAKGWKATMDGKPVPIYPTNYYLRGIAVPAGTHVIEMRYRPPGIIIGLVLSLLSFTAMLVMALWPKIKESQVAE